MKKKIVHFVFLTLVSMLIGSCGDKALPNGFIGKWDTINDKESSLQKAIEIKEGNTFVETWIVYDDDGNLFGELEIKGRCELTATEGVAHEHALCLVYDLESLSDPDGILETMEQKDYFKKENDSYESAKRQGKVYGLQNARVSGSILFYNGGEWKLVDDAMENAMEKRKDQDTEESPHVLTVSNVEYWDNVEEQGGNTYIPANMLDGNPATAWAVNLDKASYDSDKLYGPIFYVKCKKLSHIVICNGYAKDTNTFKNNARASRIIFCNSEKVSDEDKQASYLFEGMLKDTPDRQTLKIDPNIACNNNITQIQLIFPSDGLRKGAKWNDLCVSEIEFWGY